MLISSEYKNQPLAWSLLPNGSQSLSIAGNNTVNHPGKAKILSGFRQQAGGQNLPPSPGWICLSEVSDGSSQAAMAGMHCHCSGYLHAYERWHGVFRCCLDTHIYEPCLGSVQLRNKVTGRSGSRNKTTESARHEAPGGVQAGWICAQLATAVLQLWN